MQPIVRGYTNKLKVPFILMTILALAALAAAGYFFWQTQEEGKAKRTAENDLKSAKQEISRLESSAELAAAESAKVNDKVKNEKTSSVASDDAAEAAKTYYLASGSSASRSNVTANKVQESGEFRRYNVGLTGQGGGASVIVKKVGDAWVAVFVGQDSPPKTIGQQFNMPSGWYSNE